MKHCIVTPEGKHLKDPWDLGAYIYEKAPLLDSTTGKLPVEVLPIEISAGIPSNPPTGCKKVKNLYVNQAGKLIVIYDDTSV